MKKIICTILTAVMLFSMSVPAFASYNNSVQPTSNSLSQPRASLVITSNRPAVSSGKFTSSVSLNNIGSADVTLTLEKKSGSTWEYVDSESWYGETIKSKTFSKAYSITERGTYRCVSYVSATVNGNSDTNETVSSSFTK